MGAAACSDVVHGDASRPVDRKPQPPEYWHDKMQMSAASQALFKTAQRGDTKGVLNALNVHGDPNCVNASGFTALMLAVGGGFQEVAALLLQASGDVNHAVMGVTPLMIAGAGGQVSLVRMLVNCGASSLLTDHEQGRTALHRAAQRGHSEVAQLLLQSGALVDSGDQEGCTPMLLAAESGHDSVVKVLLRAGADPTADDKKGSAAIFQCVEKGHEACLAAMLQVGVLVNSAHRVSGDSPLITAARCGNSPLCRRLLEFQANVNFASNEKETALIAGSHGGHAEVVHLLLSAGADTTARDLRGYTPLMHGAMSGNALVVSVMLDFGAAPSTASPMDLNTPLTVATFHGHTEAYSALVNAGSAVPAVEQKFLHDSSPPLKTTGPWD